MSLIVKLLVVMFVTQCCCAPQKKRNWTPQAMLYLKGAQRHRSVLERSSREEPDALPSVTHHHRSDRFSLSSVLLELLQRAMENGGSNPDYYSEVKK